jgi:hypothetical protein
MVHVVAPTPAATLLWDRGVETLIGLAAGFLTRRPTGSRRLPIRSAGGPSRDLIGAT